MYGHYSDPTANAAIGAIDREIRAMQKQAERLRIRKKRGQLTPEEEAQARRRFTGIYRGILEKALAD